MPRANEMPRAIGQSHNLHGSLGDSLEAIWTTGTSDAATAAFQSAGGQAAVAAIVQTSVIAASDAAKDQVAKMLLPAMLIAAAAGWLGHKYLGKA